MATFCPKNLVDFYDDHYIYDGVICETGQQTQAWDSREHTTGDCDPKCPDPIMVGCQPTPGGKMVALPKGVQINRRIYAKGVPCPFNPNQAPDEFKGVGSGISLTGEYTATYDDSDHPGKQYHVRLFRCAFASLSANGATQEMGFGAEIDPQSLPAAVAVTHFPAASAKLIFRQGASHVVQTQALGDFPFVVLTSDQ